MTTDDTANTSARMVAVAIAVQAPEQLTVVPAALNGARAFGEWAVALGYDTTLITDEEKDLTIERLKDELVAALTSSKRPIARLVLYFAGHGLIREAEQGLWLLSDWYSSLRAVAVEPLRRRLSQFNIEQVAIFADCCRSLPPNMDAADLTPDAVLGRGVADPNSPEIDKFIAAQDGTEAFAISGMDPADDRCIFSGVLLEGLWGAQQQAFSEVSVGKVTSQSLGKFLKAKVPEIAQRYGKKLNPNVVPSFSNGADIYFGSDPIPVRPRFPEWPTVEAHGLGVKRAKAKSAKGRFSDRGPANFDFVGATKEPTVPVEPWTLDSNRERPAGFDTGSGFEIQGGKVNRLWVSQQHSATVFHDSNCWRIRTVDNRELTEPTPVLIEFFNGTSAAVTALPDFLATVVLDNRGVSALTYRGIIRENGTASSVSAIEQLERGMLRAGDVRDLTVKLRADKHVDPVLGVISAYLYDSIGDVDSIRRMAHYYIEHGQAIPYDIALLAQVEGMWDGHKLSAKIPATQQRKPQSDAEQNSPWTYNATNSGTGVVGGVWPWLRQGWTFLSDPADDGSTLVVRELIALTKYMTSGRFATFNAQGTEALARMFALTPRAVGTGKRLNRA